MHTDHLTLLNKARATLRMEFPRASLEYFLEGIEPADGAQLHEILFEVIKIPGILGSQLMVQDLLERFPAWVHAADDQDTSVVMWAAQYGLLEIFELLKEKGADLTARNGYGLGVLDHATYFLGHHKVQEAVMDVVGESFEFSEKDKSFALAMAADNKNLGAVRSLINQGATCLEKVSCFGEEDGRNALQLASAIQTYDVKEQQTLIEVVKMLLNSQKISEAINEGWGVDYIGTNSAMHNAAALNNVVVLKLLVEAGARMDPLPESASFHSCPTPLMLAAKDGNGEAVAFLLDAGANIGAIDHKGRNVLHWMAKTEFDSRDGQWEQNYFVPVARILMEAGADVGLMDHDGQTPSELAREHGHKILAQFFDSVHTQRTLHSAVDEMVVGRRGRKML